MMQQGKPLRKTSGNRLTAMMQVRNESGRYLEQVLEELSGFVDDIVIVDDASTDGTARLCQSFAKVTKLVTLERSLLDHHVPRCRCPTPFCRAS